MLTARNTKKQRSPQPNVDGIYHTLQWLITAFALTLVFIVFEMQAYTIPTGSMADTLKGAHFRLRCTQCGYRYDFDFVPHSSFYRMPRNVTPGQNIPIGPGQPRCPSCGFSRITGYQGPDGGSYIPDKLRKPVIKGDRIFVLKCLYQFTEPRRWDVVVFKNPLEPRINYIKRMVALPGETVELIDGDVYINDRIARKPPNVQQELWMAVYDNDYQPARPQEDRFNGRPWQQPFKNIHGSKWNLNAEIPATFTLNSPSDRLNTIAYDTAVGNNFQATYAYDTPLYYPYMPICSDLMIRFHVRTTDSAGTVGATLTKYGIRYNARIDLAGRMVIEKIDENGKKNELASTSFQLPNTATAVQFEFANVDHQLILHFGDKKLIHDLGRLPDDAGPQKNIMPKVEIFGAANLTLSHIAIFRDLHYISSDIKNMPIMQAAQGKPFELGLDEFFVLGDNTPASADARCWNSPGIGNNGHRYRQGTVPRDYLVGKAFFVYWPGPFKPFNNSAFAEFLEKRPKLRLLKLILNVPNPDGMKVISGGINE